VTSAEKEEIIKRLKEVKTESIWRVIIQQFLTKKNKTDEDYIMMVKELQAQIKDGSQVMKNVLGDNYEFFKEY
jgi:hypothetical protein